MIGPTICPIVANEVLRPMVSADRRVWIALGEE